MTRQDLADIVYDYNMRVVSQLTESNMPPEQWDGGFDDYDRLIATHRPTPVPSSQQLVNTTTQQAPNALAVLPTDVKGSVDLTPSEALIRAREAVIAGQYVTGLDAERQVRAGEHDDWLPLQIAYQALITKEIDVDILRKYHAPGQLTLAKREAELKPPVVVRERRSTWNVLCIKIARWLDLRSHKSHYTKTLENELRIANAHKSCPNYSDMVMQQRREYQRARAKFESDQQHALKKLNSRKYHYDAQGHAAYYI
jgi:hypothetical protein